MSMFSKIGPALALCAAILVPSVAVTQARPGPTPPVALGPPDPTAAEYVLGPEDVIEYEVIGTSDKVRARVYTDGSIQTNFGGRIEVAGKTPRELGGEIAAALKAGGYYASPVVNVEVVGYASRYVTVLGAVGAPGLVPINRPYRLSEVLARVGGVRPEAADYLLVRSENSAEKRYIVDKVAAGDPTQDPFVAPGDKIFAPAAEIFYIYGQVNTPGAYPVRTDMTVAQAIAKGGGLTESGSDKKVKVRRGAKTTTLSAEDKIEPGDVLTVRERLF
jgi:polysaccharide export outer membrane protein